MNGKAKDIIGFFEIEGWEKPLLKKMFPRAEMVFSGQKINDACLPSKNNFTVLSIFVNSRINKKVLAHFPKLRLVATRSTGFDHIDLQAAKKKNVAVAFVPGYGDNTVAEFAFGLILNLTRKIYQAIAEVKDTGIFSFAGLRGTDLKGKTIGIIGTGRIGKAMIKIASGFGMNILAFDPKPDRAFAKLIPFRYVELETLLEHSDVISLHTPYTKKTRHLINKKNIRLIKKGAYLVNTARGGIVETAAVVKALQHEILSGVALDVLEEEGKIKMDRILIKMPNVLITPHNAFNSQEALERILKTTIENIQSFLTGKTSSNFLP